MMKQREGFGMMLDDMIILWKEEESPWEKGNNGFPGLHPVGAGVLRTVVLQHVRHDPLHIE